MRSALWRALHPRRSTEACDLLRAMLRIGAHNRRKHRAHLRSLYGDLSGQRAIDVATLGAALGLKRRHHPLDLIDALRHYAVLVMELVSTAALDVDPTRRAADWAAMAPKRLKHLLDQIATGALSTQLGAVCEPIPTLQNTAAQIDLDGLNALKALLALLPGTWPAHLDASTDPFGQLYAELSPRDLRHVHGEFYTPVWLARLMVRQSEWTQGQHLADPFCGSGVFAIAALLESDSPPGALLPTFSLSDLNPVACAAARANLRLAIAPDLQRGARIALPVRCVDALDLNAPVDPAPWIFTNPPWVGWEYIPRPLRNALTPRWHHYGLFTARGMQAAFVKEDLSTLALITAWDRHLSPDGTCIALLRASTMTSPLASQGLRRLHITPTDTPIKLERATIFEDLTLFPGLKAKAAIWQVRKGQTTQHPIQVDVLSAHDKSWRPYVKGHQNHTPPNLKRAPSTARRVVHDDVNSPWSIGDASCQEASMAFEGTSVYRARAGVFTGGANGVFYVAPLEGPAPEGAARFRNVTVRARRRVPPIEAPLERALVYDILRGRDLGRWSARPGARLLCPHTPETRMHAIAPDIMAQNHPLAMAWLEAMRGPLEQRRGFSGWESSFKRSAFYSLQRIGAYTFSPFKVAWRYISGDFITAVLGPDGEGRPCLANDKVVSIGLDSPEEAYFLCGLLSADPIRWRVMAAASSTQISAGIISALAIPAFDPDNGLHAAISKHCLEGHRAVSENNLERAEEGLSAINKAVGVMFGLSDDSLSHFRRALLTRYPGAWFEGEKAS